MTAWTQTRFIWYRVVDRTETLYVEPVGPGFEAYIHRAGTFEPLRQRYFNGPNALADAKRYLDGLTDPEPASYQDEIDAGYHVTEDNS